MLDIKLIREHSELVRVSQKKRNVDIKEVDKLIKIDKEWRELKEEVDKLRARRNKISEEINRAKKLNKNPSSLINEAKEIPALLVNKEVLMKEKETARDFLLRDLPNIVDKSVPLGDASRNKIIGTHGKIPKFKFKVKDHADLLEENDLTDVRKASEVTGARFYYLKNDLVKLNHAIIDLALDFLNKKGFTLMQPPYMLRKEVLEGAIPWGAFGEMIYKIDSEDLYLIGTAEHALNAYHMNETINVEKPIRFAGISPCFRKEAGAHGKDTKGIFRVHQFEKIEQFVFCKPKDAWKEFDLILKNTESLFKMLEIPFRTVVLSSEDMGKVPIKTVDLEGWFPAQNCYRELGSCSNCSDYQARRSNIRYQDKNKTEFVYTLNNTAIATERMITCIVENFQQEDGSIKIPKALWKYTGFKVIKAERFKRTGLEREKKRKK